MIRKKTTAGKKPPNAKISISQRKPKSAGDSYHHGDLRNLVLKQSQEMLEADGVHNLSLRDVALAIGVSHTAPYRHFPRKIDLLYALTTQGFLDLRDSMNEAWNESEDSFVKLKRSGENYIRLLWRNPRRSELMFSGEVNLEGELPIELRTAGEEAYMGIFRIVQYGQSRGDFKESQDPESMSMSVWSAVHGFAVLNERDLKNAKSNEELSKIENQMKDLLRMIEIGIRK
jgi:AcrR family transcriptional regulator